MKLIQTKPITLKSWKWTESRNLFNQIGCKMLKCSGHQDKPDLMTDLKIQTSDGKGSMVRKGDYIIENFRGEFFVCDQNFYDENYIEKALAEKDAKPKD